MHTSPHQFETELKHIVLASLLEKGVLTRLEYEADRAEVNAAAFDALIDKLKEAIATASAIASPPITSPPVEGV